MCMSFSACARIQANCDYFYITINIQFTIDNRICMMTSSNGNIFRVTGPLCGEFTGHRWIPHTKASDVEHFFYLRLNKRLSKQPWGWWFETPLWSLWRQCNGLDYLYADAKKKRARSFDFAWTWGWCTWRPYSFCRYIYDPNQRYDKTSFI